MVEAALRQGERPDLATPLGAGLLDDLVALHEEVGSLGAVGELPVTRKRAGVRDASVLQTLATLPFLPEGSLSGATEVWFREPARVLRLGWSPVEIRSAANGRPRHPDGRQEASLPCHPDPGRAMLRRVPAAAWAAASGVMTALPAGTHVRHAVQRGPCTGEHGMTADTACVVSGGTTSTLANPTYAASEYVAIRFDGLRRRNHLD